MRVLFTSTPAVGHLAPLLSLVGETVRRGHAAAICSAHTMSPLVADGVEHLVVGPELSVVYQTSQHPRWSPHIGENTPEAIGMFFGELIPYLVADDATEAARSWAPDLVVSESLDAVGPVVAKRLGVPGAGVSLGPGSSADEVRAIRRALDRRGLARDDPALWVDPWPPGLRPPGWVGPHDARPMRPDVLRFPGPADTGDLLPPGDGPAVLLTLGTLFDRPERIQPVLDALVGTGHRVVCVGGPKFEVSSLTLHPERVRFHAFRPLEDLLGEVDVVVCHGGAGTVLATLREGLPLVVVPQGADHELIATGVEAAGVGLRRDAGEAGDAPAHVVAATREVLGSGAIRARARAMSREIAAMPGPEGPVSELEAIVRAR